MADSLASATADEHAATNTQPQSLAAKKAAARARSRTTHTTREALPDATVSVSDAAAEYIRASATDEGTSVGVRLRVLAGGCSGLSYHLDLVPADTAAADDELDVSSNGVRILMDAKSAQHIAGSVIDFEDGLLHRGFRFSNPNAAASCSCGTSFGLS